jgi:hypothetical protein
MQGISWIWLRTFSGNHLPDSSLQAERGFCGRIGTGIEQGTIWELRLRVVGAIERVVQLELQNKT